jgi:hypothetical protein
MQIFDIKNLFHLLDKRTKADKIKYFTSIHPYVGEEVDHTKLAKIKF